MKEKNSPSVTYFDWKCSHFHLIKNLLENILMEQNSSKESDGWSTAIVSTVLAFMDFFYDTLGLA